MCSDFLTLAEAETESGFELSKKTEGPRIAMLSIHSCPLDELGAGDAGGMSVYIIETALELGRQGCRVDIFTRAHGPEHDRAVALSEAVQVIHIQAGRNLRLPKQLVYGSLKAFLQGVESYISGSGTGYDLVHSHYWLSGMAGREFSLLWDIPHVVTFHTLGAVKRRLNGGESDLRLECEKRLACGCDLIAAPTARERAEILSLGDVDPSRVAVIPCGVNLDLFRPMEKMAARELAGFNKDEKIILYVGRLDPLKGLDRLLDAFELLSLKNPVRLVIIGGDRTFEDEKRKIVFLGRRPQSELPVYYSAADVFVLPSYYESFGLVGLEALACGTPVIASDVGDYRNILKNKRLGRLFNSAGVDSLADTLESVLTRSRDRDNRADGFRPEIESFSWRRTVDLLYREYGRLIENRTGERLLQTSICGNAAGII